MAICHESLPVPSKVGTVPAGFDEWFVRAAARDVDARFQTIAQAVAGLRTIIPWISEHPSMQAGAASIAEPKRSARIPDLLETTCPSSVTLPGSPQKTRRLPPAALVVAALGLGCTLAYGLWHHWRAAASVASASAQPEASKSQGAQTPRAASSLSPVNPLPDQSAVFPPLLQSDQGSSSTARDVARGPLLRATNAPTVSRPVPSVHSPHSVRPPTPRSAHSTSPTTVEPAAKPAQAVPEDKTKSQLPRRSLDMKIQ